LNLRPPGYEPGELPDCSTPRRERQYTTVDAVFWAALGFLVIAVVGGAAHVAVRAWRTWQVCVSLAVVGTAGADLLVMRAEQTEARAERATARVEELTAALERLERSRAQGRVLLGGVEEMVSVIRAVVAFARPKK
jgi:hypothetical protein